MRWSDSPSEEMPMRTPLEALRLSTRRLVQTVMWWRDTSETSQSDRSSSDVWSWRNWNRSGSGSDPTNLKL